VNNRSQVIVKKEFFEQKLVGAFVLDYSGNKWVKVGESVKF
jgi:hypothetical protein